MKIDESNIEIKKIGYHGMVDVRDERLVIFIDPEVLENKEYSDIAHEACHYLIRIRYSDDVDRMKELKVHGYYSEGLAYFIELYKELKSGKGDLIDRLLIDKLAMQILKESKNYSNAKIRAKSIIEKERENLLTNRNYREAIIRTLDVGIYKSLGWGKLADISRLMAEKVMELFDEYMESFGDVEKAVIETLRSYPEYRRRVIEGFRIFRKIFLSLKE